jgi:hypothetical protein
MEGKVGYFPILDEKEEVQWRETKLFYVKLALDTKLFDGWETLSRNAQDVVKNRIGVKAAEHYAATRRDTCDIQYSLWNTCAFPQYSTTHQSFTPTQFDAYVDLGATMIENYVTTTDGRTLQLKIQAHTPQ